MANVYLVCEMVEGSEVNCLMTAPEIFDRMDMSDCYDIEIDLWLVTGYGHAPEHCEFHGTWHDMKDPLKMTITCRGKVIDTGWGTDH